MTSAPVTQHPVTSHYEVEDLEYRMVGEGRVRIWIGLTVFSFALLLVVLRLAEVALLTQPPSRFAGSDAEFVQRTDIEDRNGELLATTIDNYALYVRPRKILDKEAAVRGILSIMPSLDAADLRRRVSLPRDEVRIARGLVPAQRRALVDSGLPGLFTRAEPMRTYPNGCGCKWHLKMRLQNQSLILMLTRGRALCSILIRAKCLVWPHCQSLIQTSVTHFRRIKRKIRPQMRFMIWVQSLSPSLSLWRSIGGCLVGKLEPWHGAYGATRGRGHAARVFQKCRSI